MQLITDIRTHLASKADPERARGQQAYMKSEMPFRGVPVPEVRKCVRTLAKRYTLSLTDIESTAVTLWNQAQFREERYAALTILGFTSARGQWQFVDLYEHMAVTGAWWDFVDELAHRIGDLLDACPNQARARVLSWSVHENMWLRRLAIESQLQRRDRTDTDLLAQVIEPNLEDREFFIRKAIGWALRDYAFANPDWVQSFVDSHKLSPLSRKEALKHLS